MADLIEGSFYSRILRKVRAQNFYAAVNMLNGYLPEAEGQNAGKSGFVKILTRWKFPRNANCFLMQGVTVETFSLVQHTCC